MSSHLCTFTALSTIGLLLFAGRPLEAATQNFCKVCHSEVEVEFRDSAHYKEDLTCTSCHGGDPSATDEESAHRPNFRGVPARAEVPEFCASCHTDFEQMRPYGLSTDQYALYLTSEHGRKFREGNTQVAVCTDCHGTHRILPRTAADNPTNRLNISTTCGQCHANKALMEPAGLSADVVEQYEAGVHAEALRQRGDPLAPDCSDCHGSHGAAPPGTGHVSKICGQCHSRTRDAFRLSPHINTMAAHGQGDCAACHANHRILWPDAQMWATSCTPCHETSSEAFRTGESIRALFTQAEEELENARQAVDHAREIPLDVDDYEARLNTASTHLVQARPLGHSLAVAGIEEMTRKARSIAREVQAEVHEQIRILDDREIIVIFIWFYILITVVATHYYKRSAR